MNKFLAHHINPNAGAGVNNPFAEPSMEQMVDMIMSGEMPKEKLGENADQIIREVNERRSQTKINPTNFKMPGEFPGTEKQFDDYYKYNTETAPNRKPPTPVMPFPSYMEVPVIPFPQEPEFNQQSEMNRYEQTERNRAPQAPIEKRGAPREDDLAFLKAFTKSRMA